MRTHPTFRPKTALVTGASMGIGAELARQLAARGTSLVLVARTRPALEALAEELRARHDVRVEIVVEDLAAAGAAERVASAVRARGTSIELLVNNAGFGAHGAFAEAPVDSARGQIAVNVSALVELTHAFLPQLIDAQGGILNVGSTAGFQPVPHMAVYGATKAFVLSFSEALWAELADSGVRVTALCPGATDTPFFARAGEAAALGKKASAADVARFGLAALDAGRPSAIFGFGNWLLANLGRAAPRETTLRIARRVMRANAQRALALPSRAGR
jgi:short-subunit dehydrogenase